METEVEGSTSWEGVGGPRHKGVVWRSRQGSRTLDNTRRCMEGQKRGLEGHEWPREGLKSRDILENLCF